MISCLVLFFVAAVVLALGGGWMLRARTYRRFFRYDVRRDQRFDFSESDAVLMPIDVDAEGFLWPESGGGWDTALLELPIATTWLGRLAEPWIEARTRHFYARQYFERGACGVRNFNLSALLEDSPAPGQRVWLHGFGLQPLAASARLVLFVNHLPANPRTVVIAPHPDDAEIAAFGLYHQTDATVITITAGDLGSFYLGQLPAGDDREQVITAQVRTIDSITAPQFGAVPAERALNLGYFDSALAEMFAAPDTPVVAPGPRPRAVGDCRRLNISPLIGDLDVPPTWHALVADLVRLFERIKPEVIATPHPLIDDHPDHAFATLAVCEALAQSGLNEGRLLLYTNHPPCSNLHPVGRTDGTVSLPPHFGESFDFHSLLSLTLSAEDQRLKLLALEAHHDLRTLPSLTPHSWAAVVRSLLACIRNQITGLDPSATSYYRRALRPNELFFVVPFADASKLTTHFLDAWRGGRIKWHACN